MSFRKTIPAAYTVFAILEESSDITLEQACREAKAIAVARDKGKKKAITEVSFEFQGKEICVQADSDLAGIINEFNAGNSNAFRHAKPRPPARPRDARTNRKEPA